MRSSLKKDIRKMTFMIALEKDYSICSENTVNMNKYIYSIIHSLVDVENVLSILAIE